MALQNRFSHLKRSFSAADESVPWMAWRETRAQLRELHSATFEAGTAIFAELDQLGEGVVARDFHAQTNAAHLSSGYRAVFDAHNSEPNGERGPSAAAYLSVHSGNVIITQDGKENELHPGDDPYYYTDDTAFTIESSGGAEVIHTVSPPQLHGRTLLLPSTPPTGPIVERERKPFQAAERARRRATVAARIRSFFQHRPTRETLPQQRTAFFIHAHPDDEASKGAGTMHLLREQGWNVIVLHLTDGEQGSLLNPALERDEALLEKLKHPEGVAEVRRGEAEAASRALDVERIPLSRPEWGMRQQGEEEREEDDSSVAEIADLIREHKPDAVFTYGKNHTKEMSEAGAYGHLDHERVNMLTYRALDDAADAHTVPEVYEHVPHISKDARWTHKNLLRRGILSPYTELLRGKGTPRQRHLLQHFDGLVTHTVNTALHHTAVTAARRAYKTQIPPDRAGVDLPIERFRQARAPSTKQFRWPLRQRTAFERAGARRVWRSGR